MGDSALHLLEVYHHCGLEASKEFKGCPDHIAMELEERLSQLGYTVVGIAADAGTALAQTGHSTVAVDGRAGVALDSPRARSHALP
jgi:hypothetical protein